MHLRNMYLRILNVQVKLEFFIFFGKIRCAMVEFFEKSAKGAIDRNYFRFRAKQIVDCTWRASTAGLVYGNSAESFSNQRAFIPDGIHSLPLARVPRNFRVASKKRNCPPPLWIRLYFNRYLISQGTKEAFQESLFSLSSKRSSDGSLST